MTSIVAANPFRCRMWHMHDRLDVHINENTCSDEIESFSRTGQLVPVMGRKAENDSEFDYVLYYGSRRLFVARHLNVKLLVELRDLCERDALIAMDNENRLRVDISPYERGRSYAAWLQNGHFKSQDDLAKAIKMSASQVSRLLKVGRLPSVIVGAFPSAGAIREDWGLALASALEDSQRRQATIQRARALATAHHRLPPEEIYRHLISASVSRGKVRSTAHDDVIKDESGVVLFRIRQFRNSIGILLPVEKISPDALVSIKGAIASLLCSRSESNGHASRADVKSGQLASASGRERANSIATAQSSPS